mmetsp:Transcript_39112/g.70122  ORF Transcript_39112/g.70122 Transcript_39112/m.70122 type:complete len:810 (-) Transcript_39112:900-3329(-)
MINMSASTAECFTCAPAVLSLLFTIFLGIVTFGVYQYSKKAPKAEPPKTKTRCLQTDACDTDAKRKKEITNLSKQLKHQKIVACNLAEENEHFTQQLTNLRKRFGEQKAELNLLKEELTESRSKCEELTLALLKYQVKEKDAKPTDDEFQSAIATLLDLAEQSVNDKLETVGGGDKKVTSAPPIADLLANASANEFSSADWTFMMSIAGLQDQSSSSQDEQEEQLHNNTKVEEPPVQAKEPASTSTVKKSKKTNKKERKSKKNLVESPLDSIASSVEEVVKEHVQPTPSEVFETTTSDEGELPRKASSNSSMKSSDIKSVDLECENLSSGGVRPIKDGHCEVVCDFGPATKLSKQEKPLNLDPEELAKIGSWASDPVSPFDSNDVSPHPNVDTKNSSKPSPPQKKNLQEEIKKRLQQWKDFYESQQAAQKEQPQVKEPKANYVKVPQQARAASSTTLGREIAMDGYKYTGSVCHDPYAISSHDLAGYPYYSAASTVPAPQWDAVQHQPYGSQCPCPDCQTPLSYPPQPALAPIRTGTPPPARARRVTPPPRRVGALTPPPQVIPDPQPHDAGLYLAEEYVNHELGIKFSFPGFQTWDAAPRGQKQWVLAHETASPYFLQRFVPRSAHGCQIVLTKEYLQPGHSLGVYVNLSKQHTEVALARYNLVFQSEQALNICGHEAYEIVYTQGFDSGIYVWSVCLLAFNQVLTLQFVASDGQRYATLPRLRAFIDSIQLVAPQPPPLGGQPWDPAARALTQGQGRQFEACVTLQKLVRSWLARRRVHALRVRQQEEEQREKELFIRVTTRRPKAR